MYYESHVTVLWKLPPDIDGVHFRRTFQFPNLLLPVMKPTILIPFWPFQHRNVSIFQCRITSDNMCQ